MRRFLPCFMILFGLMQAQDYSDYRIRYDTYEGDDPKAFQFINPSILKAKRERNYPELFQAYKDAIHFTPNQKIAYADSAIWAASLTKNSDLIGTAYLTKGTVYYFNYRKFKPALDEYLKAWEYNKRSNNQYLYYKNLYHIGVVKSYLGYYVEALEIFTKCEVFFRTVPSSPEPPNLQYNRKKGYLNTLHQSAICLLEVSRFQEAQSAIDKGFATSGTQADFYLERSYFYQLKGVVASREHRDTEAITMLNNSLPGLQKKNDFTHASIVYFYKGKSYAQLGNEAESIKNFVKVDSIFRQYTFVLPQVRESYEYLIDYYHQMENREQELYYTAQLLKVDQRLMLDFKYLSGKIHKEYDTGDLLASKKRLEHSVSSFYILGWSAGIMITMMSVIIYYKSAKGRQGRASSAATAGKTKRSVTVKAEFENQPKVPDAVAVAVLAKLEVMEQKNFFLEKGMSLHKLAPQLNTNSNYLSIIIKEYRGCHFNAYIKQKRIAYITNRLRESKKWRNYSVETLATECGFADRNNFSNAFLEYNHMKPLDFIRQMNESTAKEV